MHLHYWDKPGLSLNVINKSIIQIIIHWNAGVATIKYISKVLHIMIVYFQHIKMGRKQNNE